MSISLCMITKNEENNLAKLLSTLKHYIDEIIIVDTGSSDKTIEIAKQFTQNIYQIPWQDDFSKARNFSISKATKEWILWLDPDEEINDLEKLKQLTQNKSFLGYRFIQQTYFNNKLISTRGICKLFQNKNIKFIYPIHESVLPSIKSLNGRIGKTGIIINHYPNLSKEKTDYYLQLLEKKKQLFPDSSVEKEIENEKSAERRIRTPEGTKPIDGS